MPPWFRDVTPDNPEEDSECDLPELHEHDPLPLAYWDGLFYALNYTFEPYRAVEG